MLVLPSVLLMLAGPPCWAPVPAAPPRAAQSAGDDEADDEKARQEALEKRAKEAVATLQEALRAKEPAARRAALADASAVVHPRVIEAMAKALRDDDAEVRGQVIVHFGEMQHPDALAALRDHARRRRKALEKDPERHALLLRSVGFHADVEQIPWLIDGAFDDPAHAVRRARVLTVARTRSRAAIEAILDAAAKQEPSRVHARFGDARVALVWITGTDQGEDPRAWARWWRENAKTFEVPAAPPKLAEPMARAWAYFWGEERPEERQKRRGDRG